MKIIAHRGYSAKYPDNSIKAFVEAKNAGADGFECDVWFKFNREPVVTHNVYSFGAHCLEEVLQFVAKEEFPVYLHLKIATKRNFNKVLELIQKTETEKLVRIMVLAGTAKRLGPANHTILPFFRFPYLGVEKYIAEYNPEKIAVFVPRNLQEMLDLENRINQIQSFANKKGTAITLGIFNTKKGVMWAEKTQVSEIWTANPVLVKDKTQLWSTSN